jgi:toxin ParE1/3/4
LTGYVLSKAAVADLRAIWKTGEAQWGVAQAEHYALAIRRAAETVAADPRRGRPCDDLRPGYRKFSVGAHLLFFRPHPAGIEIVRILHQRMDSSRHL